MLSEFGKFCRKLRIERGELLKDMAQKLQVTPSYLSAVETGKRAVPETWIKKISDEYNLNQKEVEELKKAKDISAQVIKLDFNNKSDSDKETLLKLARSFDSFSSETKAKLIEIIKEEKNK